MTRVLAADWVLPVEGPPIEDGAVAVDGERIVAVGRLAELGTATERYPDAAIVPGFVNAHSHIEYAVYAGFGDTLEFGPWIALHTERKARIGLDEMTAIARVGAAECLASGITTIGDASFSGGAAIAAAELGLRAIVYIEVFGDGTAHVAERFERHRDRIADVLSERVRVGVSPHTPFTASDELYAACLDLGVPVATHFAETAAEQEWLRSGTGVFEPYAGILVPPTGETGIQRLARGGLLDSRMIAAHCVHVAADEVELLASHDVAVAHCPRSNALLGCGIAPVRELREAGLRVGIGTDGLSSVPSHDFFDELRGAVAFARAREQRADAMTAATALELGTLGGARALGLDGEVGSLVAGKRADLAVVSLAQSPFLPWEDPAAAVVFGGSPHRVLTTVVDGEVRYEREDSAWHELRRNAASARRRMLAPSPRPAGRPADLP